MLSAKDLHYLKSKFYITDFDDISKQFNKMHNVSEVHAIFDTDNSVRFYEGNTKVVDGSPEEASAALGAFKLGLHSAKKISVKIENAGLLCLPNKMGLHNRENIPVDTGYTEKQRSRWLLKTYNFSSMQEYLESMSFFKRSAEGVIQEIFN